MHVTTSFKALLTARKMSSSQPVCQSYKIPNLWVAFYTHVDSKDALGYVENIANIVILFSDMAKAIV